ncbi:hotdog fold thioesterase [Streptomyces sp. SBST2-5]|uniref:Hotdog fold thioesterase n=1 Tax=Streptomyces composti TaxID=2720025 RepID=A0ABX1A417_9ACTN|nr:hotdog fold thioesterase [Streptomyces composti]NJP51183.1 hotdog fold thioesterase [Streptomyces composti]
MAQTALGPVGVLPSYADQQLVERLGIDITVCEPDLVVGTMPVDGNRQPIGLLHGGANAVLAETLGSLAAWVHAGADRIIVGQELSCTHHAGVRNGRVTGVCRPLHVGRTSATYEIVITDQHDRRTCTARLTCAIPSDRRRRGR